MELFLCSLDGRVLTSTNELQYKKLASSLLYFYGSFLQLNHSFYWKLPQQSCISPWKHQKFCALHPLAAWMFVNASVVYSNLQFKGPQQHGLHEFWWPCITLRTFWWVVAFSCKKLLHPTLVDKWSILHGFWLSEHNFIIWNIVQWVKVCIWFTMTKSRFLILVSQKLKNKRIPK